MKTNLCDERIQQLEAEIELLKNQINRLEGVASKHNGEHANEGLIPSYYRAIYEHSAIAILLTAPDGSIYSANPAACLMFGMTEEELCGLGRSGVVDPSDSRLPLALREREQTGRFFGELTLRRKNGELFPAEVSTVVFQASSGQLLTSMMIRDLSVQKRLFNQLQECEQKYHSLFDHSIVGISRVLPNGQLVQCNFAYAQMYGYNSPEEMLSQVTDIGTQLYAHIEDREYILRKLEISTTVGPLEVEVVHRTGRHFFVLVNAQKICDDQGRNLYLQAEHIDITEIKKARDEILESGRFSQNTLDALSSHVCVVDESSTILAVNQAWREFSEKNPPVLPNYAIGMNYLQVCDTAIGEDAREAAVFADGLRAVLSGQTDRFTMVYPCSAPNQDTNWFQAHITRFKGQGAVRAVITHENITVLIQKEKALQESIARFSTIFHASPISIAISRLSDGILVDVNEAWERVTGYDRMEVLGHSPFEFGLWIHPEERLFFMQAILNGTVYSRDIQIRRKDGAVRDLIFTAQKIEPAGEPYMISQAIDITERNQAQQARLEIEERYDLLFNNSIDAILLVSSDGSIQAANDAACRLFQRSEAELVQLNRYDLVDSTDLRVPQAFGEQDRTGRHFGELTFVRKDGTKFPAEVSIFNREVVGRLLSGIIIRDISERKRAEEIRDKLYKQVVSVQKELQHLSHKLIVAQENERHMLSHELHDVIGQALTAVKIDLQGISRMPRNKIDFNRSIEIVDQAIQQVRQISLNLHPAILDDLGLIPAVRWLLDQYDQYGVNIFLNISLPTKRFHPDIEIACYRIIQEALTNIIRHAKANRIDVDLRWINGRLELQIADDGIGFDVKKALQRARAGDSIGLIGMQERANLVGGRLDIYSNPGKGSKIVLKIADIQDQRDSDFV